MTSTDFNLPDTPLRQYMNRMIASVLKQYGKKAEDGLYLVVKKRWEKRVFDGDEDSYIAGLINDVSDAKREFQECFYDDDATESVLSTLKFAAIDLKVRKSQPPMVSKSNQVEEQLAFTESPPAIPEAIQNQYPFASFLYRFPSFFLIAYFLLPVAGMTAVEGHQMALMVVFSGLSASFYITAVAMILRKLSNAQSGWWRVALITVHVAFCVWTVLIYYVYFS